MRILGYIWAAPLSLLGLMLVLLGGGRYMGRGGALLFIARTGWPLGWWFRRTGVLAFAWGWVVVYRDRFSMNNKRTRRHELEHVRQACVWGPVFPLAYLVAGVWEAAHGRDSYADNYFERQARRAAA